MAITGAKPDADIYTFDNCVQVVVLKDNTGTLPPCPKYSGTKYY